MPLRLEVTGFVSDTTNVRQAIKSFEVSPEFDGFSKVIINVTDELSYEAGTTTGRTLTLSCPWGTQVMANNILGSVQGFQYQPLKASGTLLDPSAELGDGVTVNGAYSGLYEINTTYGQLCAADISAPSDEEIDHEYPFETVADRQIIRKFAETRSEFVTQADEIAAKVEKTGGDASSFGWTLTEDGFVLASNGREIFRADDAGITVTGKINATSGFIGSGENGFEITANAIRNGVLSAGDTAHYGVYLGTDGITLGKGAFRVDSAGNLYAQSGTFKGNVYANGIQVGGSAGYISGGQIGGGAVGSYNCDGYMTGGASNGYYSYDCLNDNRQASTINCVAIRIGAYMIIGGARYSPYVSEGVLHMARA